MPIYLKTKASIHVPDAVWNNLEKYMQKQIYIKMSESLDKITILLRKRLNVFVKTRIQKSDTYLSVIYGELENELGVINGKDKMKRILDTWIQNIYIDYDLNTNLTGYFKVGVLRSDYQDVLSKLDGWYMSRTKKGMKKIEWLRWLLLEDTKPIVLGFRYLAKKTKSSRTGFGIMIKSKSGRSYAIPPEHAGIPGDNFAYRALNLDSEFEKFFDKTFRYYMIRAFK